VIIAKIPMWKSLMTYAALKSRTAKCMEIHVTRRANKSVTRVRSKTTTMFAFKRLTIARINTTTAIVIIAKAGINNQLKENSRPNKMPSAKLSAKVLVKV